MKEEILFILIRSTLFEKLLITSLLNTHSFFDKEKNNFEFLFIRIRFYSLQDYFGIMVLYLEKLLSLKPV